MSKKLWKDVTDTFSDERRHYHNTYMEICEVLGETIEISLFSSEEDLWEIYVSFGPMYGISYADVENAWEIREQMKHEIAEEYEKNKEKPSDSFINPFAEKYKLTIENSIFDEGLLMDTLMKSLERFN